MLNTSGRDRLCLTAWRGKWEDSAAAVFLRCPQGKGRQWRSSKLFEWRAAAIDGAFTGDRSGSGRAVGADASTLVRVTPRIAPHLCLSVPPIASPTL